MWGEAFKDESLKYGVFYPAVAPIYQGDTITVIEPEPEDW